MRIVLVSYYYPPDVSVGAVRWPPLVAALRERGHQVTVLTTSAFGSLPDDGDRIVRTRDLEAPGPARRLLRRPQAPATAGGAAERTATPPPRLLTHGPVPDAKAIGWLPFAAAALRRLVRERRPDVVITNGPPDSTHLAPLAARDNRAGRLSHLIDLEDGWRFEPLRGAWPTRAQDRLDAVLEARVFRRANGVMSLTRPVLDDAAARYGVPTHYVPIAIPEGVRSAHPTRVQEGDVVHTGALSHPERRDPRGLIAALSLLPEDSPARLVLAGGLTDADRTLLATAPPQRILELGPLPNDQARALQAGADALLLLATGPHTSVVTGKLFEYFGAGRPIVAVASANEAARLVRETGTGVVVAPDDPAAIARALAEPVPHEPRGLERFGLPAVVDALEAALETCLPSAR